MGKVKGYKVFNPDWTCRDFQYEVGKTYKLKKKPAICREGFHFCEKADDCFKYYDFDPNNKVAEILALGEIDTDGTKSCTNKIQIVREISWFELLKIINMGKSCTGFRNSGNYNSGDYNTGDYNSGSHNTGHYNSGYYNSGNYNNGNCNTGNYNSGERNTGKRNSGNRNSGDWNKTNFSNGCFNTIESKIYLFNKPSKWTYRDWLNSQACRLLEPILNEFEWIRFNDMTVEEKEAHPEAKTVTGYLKKIDNSKNIIWWKELPEEDKATIKSIPNFNKEIFKEITGIDVDYIKEGEENNED